MKHPFLTLLLIPLLIFRCSVKTESPVSVVQVKCNGLENPAGTDSLPVFSWLLSSDERGQKQSAFRIIVSSDPHKAEKGKGDFWDSGKIPSSKNAWIKYDGKSLLPGKEYFWKVIVWDKKDRKSAWSSTGSFITGLYSKDNWAGAGWIGYEEIDDSLLLVPGVHGNGDNLGSKALRKNVVPLFRKEFTVKAEVEKAIVFISGLGHYELSINGEKTGDRFLSPGWTDYRKTCLYNTYDVTADLVKGQNTLGVIIGNGFYNVNRERYRKLVIAYGAPKMILKMLITYTDGSTDTIVSDETWKTAPSPVTFASIYGGEDYDARLEKAGWDENKFDDYSWKNAVSVRQPEGRLKPETDNPVKIMESFEPVSVTERKDSLYVYDFGQNASGIIKIKVRGKSGQTVRFHPGELLGEDSLVTQQATGSPYIFSYTLKGASEEIWMPRFTYYGFRYLQAEGGVPAGKDQQGKPVIEAVEMLHTRNSSNEDGSFTCSNELFNRINELIKWAIKSNLASVVTDCPHREKLGWLEQTHLMGNSIRYNYDIHNLYTKVIDDMIEAQLDNGLVPDIAPEYVPFYAGFRDSPEWGSAAVILPWYMYEWYGDQDIIRKAYPMVKRYVDYLSGMADNHILSHGLGDWYDLGPKFPGEAQLTPKAVTATSIYYYDISLLSKMAALTGNSLDEEKYRILAEDVRAAFNKKFLNPESKVYSTGSQTAYAMPLYFGMADENIKNLVVQNLAESINEGNKALTAGDIGYRYLLRVLEQEGYSQLIYEMNSRSDVPGYGYQLSKGATALTESWAALKYVSNNHLMLGHLMEWFYSGLGGIRQDSGSTAYEKIIIAPQIVGDLNSVNASFNTIHGKITSNWKTDNDSLRMEVIIPVGCTAVVEINQNDPGKITESGIKIENSRDISGYSTKGDKTLCKISSGKYIFSTPFKGK
jgi:hypothetical protein